MRCYIWREYYAICDGCNTDLLELSHHECSVGANRTQAFQIARTYGWRTLNKKLLCPECQKDNAGDYAGNNAGEVNNSLD